MKAAVLGLALATGACGDAAGPGDRAEARDFASDLDAVYAALHTAPWQSYASTRLGANATLPPPGDSGGGVTWTWSTRREGYQPSELPGGVPGTVRYALYPLDSLGRRIEPPGNPVGYADIRSGDEDNQSFRIQVGGGPTVYADYVILGADLSRTGSATGTFSGPHAEVLFDMNYREVSPGAGRADFHLNAPARDLFLRVSSGYVPHGQLSAFRATLGSKGRVLDATGSLTGDTLQMMLLQDQHPLAVVKLMGDSALVTRSRRTLSGSTAENAITLGRLIRTVIHIREALSDPVEGFQK